MVPLTRGLFALIDPQYIDRVAIHNWYATPSKGTHYARADVWLPVEKRRERLYLHRLIADAPADRMVDHINGSGLDCRRCNLRVCVAAENAANRHDARGSTSRYRGVRFDATRGRWSARLTHNYRALFLGYFDTELEAASAYDAAARERCGEFASLNHAS